MTLVTDASIVIRLLANRRADTGLRRQLAARRGVHAPQLLDAEVISGVRGLVLGGKVSGTRAGEMVEDFSQLRIHRHPLTPYLSRVLALRHTLTAYDAFYVALAEALELPLLTLDGKFTGATGHHAEIRLYRTGGEPA